jgi:hypothetical protein
MRNGYLILIIGLLFTGFVLPPSMAGDIPVSDVEFVRRMLLQPDADFSPFIGEDLCDAFIWLIENDDTPQRERVVNRAVARFWVTGDERAVPYLIDYLDEYTMDCLYNLGEFSIPESCKALLGYVDDEDEFNRRFSVESLGKLDFTVSEEMWELRDDVLSALGERLKVEEEEWIMPIINDAYLAVSAQVFVQDGNGAED